MDSLTGQFERVKLRRDFRQDVKPSMVKQKSHKVFNLHPLSSGNDGRQDVNKHSAEIFTFQLRHRDHSPHIRMTASCAAASRTAAQASSASGCAMLNNALAYGRASVASSAMIKASLCVDQAMRRARCDPSRVAEYAQRRAQRGRTPHCATLRAPARTAAQPAFSPAPLDAPLRAVRCV